MKNKTIFKARDVPIHQNVTYHTLKEARLCPRGNITLIQDCDIGFIYNADFNLSAVTYDENYQNEQACSLVFQEHLSEVISIVGRNFNQKNIVEIGCGKGWFLELLRSEGFNVIGVDPAYEGEKDYVIKEYFSSNLNLKADALVLRHTLEHIQNPIRFLNSIAQTNNYAGLIYIEVPCFEWIQKHKAWFDIFYEHVNYFRLADFEHIFGEIVDKGYLFGGQYMYIVGNLASLSVSNGKEIKAIEMPDDFLIGLQKVQKIIKRDRNKKNIIWGGSAKGVTCCHYLSQRGVKIEILVDIDPSKQGKHIPITGIKIESPKMALKKMNEGDNVFIMNSNYLNEIKFLTNNKYNYIQVDQL